MTAGCSESNRWATDPLWDTNQLLLQRSFSLLELVFIGFLLLPVFFCCAFLSLCASFLDPPLPLALASLCKAHSARLMPICVSVSIACLSSLLGSLSLTHTFTQCLLPLFPPSYLLPVFSFFLPLSLVYAVLSVSKLYSVYREKEIVTIIIKYIIVNFVNLEIKYKLCLQGHQQSLINRKSQKWVCPHLSVFTFPFDCFT